MKILVVNINLAIGGGEHSLVAFLNHIDYSKYDVDLFLLHPGEDLLDKVNKNVNVIFGYKDNPYLDLQFNESFKNCIKNKKYSYLLLLLLLSIIRFSGINPINVRKHFPNRLEKNYDVAIGFKQGRGTNYVANFVNAKKKISRFNYGKIKQKGLLKIYYTRVYNKIDYIITLNKKLKEMLIKDFLINDAKIKVIPNFFETDTIIEKSKEYIIERNTKYVFSTVGRIVPIKRIDLAIDVAKRLADNNIIDFKWYIVGEFYSQKYADFLRKKVICENLEDKIIFTGGLKNPFPYIKASDIYLQFSSVDAMPRVINEALVLAKPVLATKTVGASIQIRPGVNGELADIDNLEDILCKLIDMLYNLDKYKNINYEIDNKRIIEDYYKLFEYKFNGEFFYADK